MLVQARAHVHVQCAGWNHALVCGVFTWANNYRLHQDILKSDGP